MTIPAAAAPVIPQGCPSASTQCPGRSRQEAVWAMAGRPPATTASAARSALLSVANTRARRVRPSARVICGGSMMYDMGVRDDQPVRMPDGPGSSPTPDAGLRGLDTDVTPRHCATRIRLHPDASGRAAALGVGIMKRGGTRAFPGLEVRGCPETNVQ